MSIIHYSPWTTVRNIQEEMNEAFDRSLMDRRISQWKPHVDIIEEKDRFVVNADLPGVSPEKIKVTLDENDVLTIKGEKNIESQKEEKGQLKKERFSGSFERQFSLPDNVDTKGLEAKSKHGVLQVIIPKKEAKQPKEISVSVEEG